MGQWPNFRELWPDSTASHSLGDERLRDTYRNVLGATSSNVSPFLRLSLPFLFPSFLFVLSPLFPLPSVASRLCFLLSSSFLRREERLLAGPRVHMQRFLVGSRVRIQKYRGWVAGMRDGSTHARTQACRTRVIAQACTFAHTRSFPHTHFRPTSCAR